MTIMVGIPVYLRHLVLAREAARDANCKALASISLTERIDTAEVRALSPFASLLLNRKLCFTVSAWLWLSRGVIGGTSLDVWWIDVGSEDKRETVGLISEQGCQIASAVGRTNTKRWKKKQ